MLTAFIVSFALVTAVSDVLSRRIPKWLAVCGLVAGLGFHLADNMLLDAVAAVALAFAFSTFLFWMGAIGGGDAKLMIALGALFGLKSWIYCIALAFIAAAVMGLCQSAYAGKLRQTLRNVRFLATHLLVTGVRPHPELNVRQSSAMGSPFALATAVGSLLTLFLLRMPVR
ncbi:MAG: prepilin peptidase [Acidobacteriales bacterium]|nr:prepilin peptidase [Terriglobales bacterium]